MPNDEKSVSIYISAAALELLKKRDYPCSEQILASAEPTDEGFHLVGTRSRMEMLAGFVAGDANHEDRRAKRKVELLYELAEEIEGALAARGRTGW